MRLTDRNSLRYPALPLKPPTHTPVPGIDGLAEHQRAAPDDAVDAKCFALSNGLIGDATVPKGPVEPHSAYTVVTALPYDFD